MTTSKPLKDEVLRARVPAGLKARIKTAYDNYGVSESTLLRDGLEAILEYIEREEGYRRPVQMFHSEGLRAVAEEQTAYLHGTAKTGSTPKTPDKSKRRGA